MPRRGYCTRTKEMYIAFRPDSGVSFKCYPEPVQLSDDIMGEKLDQSEFHGSPKKIFICTVPRSGSWMLCRYMINNGLGIPGEYFNPIYLHTIGRRLRVYRTEDAEWKSPGRLRRWLMKRRGRDPKGEFVQRYTDALLKHRTLNNVFATKIMWDDYEELLRGPVGDRFLSGGVFIYLHRADLLARAVSYHFARQSGRWGSSKSETTAPAAVPDYRNRRGIEDCIKELAEFDARWQTFFLIHGIVPMAIKYEDFVKDPNRYLVEIAARAGVDPVSLPLTYREQSEPNPPPPGALSKRQVVEDFLTAPKRIQDGSRVLACCP